MVFRIGEDKGPIDFTASMWGHTLHATTFQEVGSPYAGERQEFRWWQFVEKMHENERLAALADEEARYVRRYSFLVHTSQTPTEGRKVRWKGPNGTVEGTLYDWEWLGNPRDMYKFFVILEGNPDE